MLEHYFGAGGCSISPHIALREAGLSFELCAVDFARGKRLEAALHEDGHPDLVAFVRERVGQRLACVARQLADSRT